MIPLNQCKKGWIYRIHSRNLLFGVFDGEDSFIGIRTKFGERYLFTEIHHDASKHFGTVTPIEAIEEIKDIPIIEPIATIDNNTKRPVAFDRSGRGGWYFTDTNEEANETVHPVSVSNKALFKRLEKLEGKA